MIDGQARKIESNRADAKASTGPKSAPPPKMRVDNCPQSEESIITKETPVPGTLRFRMPSEFFGPTLLLEGENSAGYKLLLDNVIFSVKPFDFSEDIWAGEIADLDWDIFRLGQLKTTLLKLAMDEAVARSSRPFIDREIEKLQGTEKTKWISCWRH